MRDSGQSRLKRCFPTCLTISSGLCLLNRCNNVSWLYTCKVLLNLLQQRSVASTRLSKDSLISCSLTALCVLMCGAPTRPMKRGWVKGGHGSRGMTHAQCNWSCGRALRLVQFRRGRTRFYCACVYNIRYDLYLASFHRPCRAARRGWSI